MKAVILPRHKDDTVQLRSGIDFRDQANTHPVYEWVSFYPPSETQTSIVDACKNDLPTPQGWPFGGLR